MEHPVQIAPGVEQIVQCVWVRIDAIEDFLAANPNSKLVGETVWEGRKMIGLEAFELKARAA